MGYRSNVVAMFYAPTEKIAALKLYVDENFPTVGDLMKDEDLRWFKGNSYCGYIFEHNDVKWYPNFAEVIAFTNFVSAFVELAEGDNAEALGWSYEFVRVGEDYEDIQFDRSSNCAYFLDVTRSIEINC